MYVVNLEKPNIAEDVRERERGDGSLSPGVQQRVSGQIRTEALL